MHALLTPLLLIQPATTTAPAPQPTLPIVDGELNEFADSDFLLVDDMLQVRIPSIGMRSLTGGPENVALLLDLDGDPATGADLTADGGVPGIDLRIDFNAVWPVPKQGERGKNGSMVTAYTADGDAVVIHQFDVGLTSAPTHAADSFEVRINPQLTGASAELAELRPFGDVSGVVLLQDRGNQRTIARKRLQGDVERRETGAATADAATLPTKPDGALRVVSWNVLYNGPAENPQPYADIIAALKPDVLMVQEWSQQPLSDQTLAAWFDQHTDGTWFVETSTAQGVAIVSRFPISDRGPDHVDATPENENDPSMRLAAAVVQTPSGPVTFGTVHLKCCGFYQSSEDEKRSAEVAAAAAALSELRKDGPIVFAGDFNLVGSPAILEADLPTPMTVVAPTHLDQPTLMHTWQDPEQNFGRSRLDFFLRSTSLEQANAFVFNPALIDVTNPSDHFPIVVDLMP